MGQRTKMLAVALFLSLGAITVGALPAVAELTESMKQFLYRIKIDSQTAKAEANKILADSENAAALAAAQETIRKLDDIYERAERHLEEE